MHWHYFVALLPFFLMVVIIGLVVFMGFWTVPANCDELIVMDLINQLREREGARVEIACSNPDPSGPDYNNYECVTVWDDWTNYEPQHCYARTLRQALEKLVAMREAAGQSRQS